MRRRQVATSRPFSHRRSASIDRNRIATLLTIQSSSRQRHRIAEVLFFGGYSTACLAYELRVSHERFELLDVKVARTTSHRTHLLIVIGTVIGFCHSRPFLDSLSSLAQCEATRTRAFYPTQTQRARTGRHVARRSGTFGQVSAYHRTYRRSGQA